MDSKLIENMNLEEDVSVLVSNLKNIEGEYKKILNKYLEFNNLNSVAAYRLMKELKEVRLKRRTAEDTVNLLNNIALQLKFNSKSMDTDKILKDRKKQLDNRKYKMRCYTERQLKNIANLPVYKGGEENV